MVLQQLVEVGHLQVSDCLLDDNNVAMKVSNSIHMLDRGNVLICGHAYVTS